MTLQDGFKMCAAEDSAELEIYLHRLEEAGEQISGTDKPLVRVIEDLIDLLVDREVILFTDLPGAAQNKLMNRRRLRENLKPGLELLDHSEKTIY